jgi:hypothetical protein
LFTLTPENLIIVLKPDMAHNDKHQQIKSLLAMLGHPFPRANPPTHHLIHSGRGKLRPPAASEHFEPDLPTINTFN